ncbi:uncharacterized protein LOC117613145 [Prunus dulcis]|uniref:uncharacterized protein LOC117613145 n=1 Tax=Prunus dulcis TaxID=3755 RepID=UPI0014821B3A|nr:uncharacterized protein LOC117613145 [Prunus dulcis]
MTRPTFQIIRWFLLVFRPSRLTPRQLKRKFKFYQISAQIPETQTDHSTDGRILQTISADQTANVSDVLPAIPVTLSDEPESQIPQPSSDVSTPILTDQPHEVCLDILLFHV